MQVMNACERLAAAPATKQLQMSAAVAVQGWAARPGDCCVKTNKAWSPACVALPIIAGTVTLNVNLRYHQHQLG